MSFDVKLKDKIGAEQTYSGVQQVGIPKSDGSGNAWFVEHPYVSYNIRGFTWDKLPTETYSGTIAESYIGEEQVFYLKGAVSSAGQQIYAVKTNSMRDRTTGEQITEAVSPDGYYYFVKVNGNISVTQLATLFGWQSDSTRTISDGVFAVLFTDSTQYQIRGVSNTLIGVMPGSSVVAVDVAQPCQFDQSTSIRGSNQYYNDVLIPLEQDRSSLIISNNGITYLKTPFGNSGIYSATITTRVAAEPNLQSKSVEIVENGTSNVTPDSGYDGLSSVEVVVDVPAEITTEQITSGLAMAGGDQVLTPEAGKAYSKVTITKPATMIPGNIKKDVNIGGVVGTLDTGGGGGGDVSNWGDAEGEGCIIYSPDGISIDVYGKTIQDLGLLDNTNYVTWLNSNWRLSQSSLQTELDAWAAKIMTPGTAENTRFTSIFSGADKAIFMWNDKKIECDVPSFQDSDPKTYAGLVGALKRTLPTNTFGRWNQNEADNCITEYGNGYDYSSSTHVTFPFVWSPAQSVNNTAKYMTLQTPIETVPDLSLIGESVIPLTEIFYLNIGMAIVFYPLEGSDVQYAALMIGDLYNTGLYAYSYGAQTVTHQNASLTFPQGWSKATLTSTEIVFSSITEADMQTEIGNNGGFDTVGYLSMNAFDFTNATEEEERVFRGLIKWGLSFFKLQDGTIYGMKNGANRFEMRFNLAKVQS